MIFRAQRDQRAAASTKSAFGMVGPLGFEPRTNGSLQKLYVVGFSCISLRAVERFFTVFGIVLFLDLFPSVWDEPL